MGEIVLYSILIDLMADLGPAVTGRFDRQCFFLTSLYKYCIFHKKILDVTNEDR